MTRRRSAPAWASGSRARASTPGWLSTSARQRVIRLTVTAMRPPSSGWCAPLLAALVAPGFMAVLFGVGVPSLSRLRSPSTLGGAARQIAADLQATRQRAIARNVSYRVNFDAAHGSYTIERAQAGIWVADSAP